MSTYTHAQPRPLGGPVLAGPVMKGLAGLAALGVGVMIWRLMAGLGAVTALNDGYPWGIWIAFDVVTGTALACGGYAIALMVYILNRGQYHPLVRPALLTSAAGYTLAGLSIVLDVGRPWLTWKVPLYFWSWNLNSALLEVALCIMAYIVVLQVELAPVYLEQARESRIPRLRALAERALPWFGKAMPWIVALGLLLPTMHQSSLGSLMMLAGPRVHGLWWTPWLPFLFLVSCMTMGYAAVVFESTLSARLFGRPQETRMLGSLSGVIAITVALYLGVRLSDLAWRGKLGLAAAFDLPAVMFLLEMALFAAPLLILASARRRERPASLFAAGMLLMLGGGVYRFDTYLVAFNPGPQWSYFPSVPEQLMTLGVVALEILGYVFVVRRFPILGGMPAAPAARS
ncbi:MAG TPA: Ni/Fe-hydrogenase cytochrome b subunit [Vicinamibacteria bacterium]|jgi:Ni/Fe-hydrogenase subunit HybB-like protein